LKGLGLDKNFDITINYLPLTTTEAKAAGYLKEESEDSE